MTAPTTHATGEASGPDGPALRPAPGRCVDRRRRRAQLDDARFRLAQAPVGGVDAHVGQGRSRRADTVGSPTEILSVPAYLIGIITAVGLVALRKSVGTVIGGGLKATLGFLLVGAGTTLVTVSLDPPGVMIQGALGAQGVYRRMRPSSVSRSRSTAPRCRGS